MPVADAAGTATRAALLKRSAVVGATVLGAGAVAGAARAGDDGPRVFNAYDAGARPDGATDNTAILQGLLDTIRDSAGGGQLYFPYVPSSGSVYLTRGLWVPSYTRITADPGIEIRAIGPSLDNRAQSNDSPYPDIPANGLFTISSQEAHGFAHKMHDVQIEGQFTINANNAILYCLEFNGAQDVRVRDVMMSSGVSDNVILQIRNGNRVPGNENARIGLHRCVISSAGRNGVSLIAFRHVTLDECTISGSRGFPAAGIDVEPNFSSDPVRGLIVRNCLIAFNGREAIIFNPPTNGGLSSDNTDHLIEGCMLYENSLDRSGGNANQIQFATNSGQGDALGAVRLVGNAISRSNGGNSVRNDSAYYQVIAVGNVFGPAYSGPATAFAGNWNS